MKRSKRGFAVLGVGCLMALVLGSTGGTAVAVPPHRHCMLTPQGYVEPQAPSSKRRTTPRSTCSTVMSTSAGRRRRSFRCSISARAARQLPNLSGGVIEGGLAT